MLRDLYQEKLNFFQQLSKLSQTMAGFTVDQLVSDDQLEERFVNLLEERATIMSEIDSLDKQIMTQESQANIQGQSIAPLRQALQAEMAIVKKHNEVVEDQIKNSLAQLRNQAHKLQSGKQSNRAYIRRAPSTEGSFIDKRR